MPKVAIISANWFPTQSVYRTLSAYVQSLRGHYELTFFNLNPGNQGMDYSQFDNAIACEMSPEGKVNNVGAILDGKFDAVYFPDVGMNVGSIILANMRLAPIMLMGTGHPISTWGSEIDYFISGDEVEAPGAEQHYSERLVLLPGLGAIYNRPTYKLQGKKKETDAILINCSWYGQKANWRCVDALAEAVKRSSKSLHFRFYSGGAVTQYNDFLPFQREMTRRLKPAKAEVMQPLAYDVYMASMEEADFGADCFPFGGSNTVSDQLHLGKPVVCLDGRTWPGRIGAALMRRSGFHGMAAWACDSVERYISSIAAWAETWPPTWEQKVNFEAVYSDAEAVYFRHAVDYLLENHRRLKAEGSREPIRIPR